METVQQACQFILKTNGEIVRFNDAARDAFGLPASGLNGVTLADFLASVDESWPSLLALPLHEPPLEPVYLPARTLEPNAVEGWEANWLTHENFVFLTLTPALAPHKSLQDASFEQLPSDRTSIARLFLRLRTAESRLASYMNNLPGVFFSQRSDLSFNYVGPHFEDMFGLPASKVLRSPGAFIDCLSESERNDFLSQVHERALRAETFTLKYRVRHRKTGDIVYLMDVRTPRLSPQNLIIGYEGVWLDITRQAIAENRLTRTAWKESLAVVTNGLIHDFSNIMAGIYSLSELYLSSLDENHSFYRGMKQIMENSRSARKLVRRIIELNREVAATRNYYNLESQLEEQLDLIRVLLPRGTRLETRFTGQELPVYIDDVSFRQMILNFAMNARDALGRNGVITIATSAVKAGHTLFQNSRSGPYSAPRDGVTISFSDTGCGIRPEHTGKIFDPFFTTKEAHKGSGFGLYNASLYVRECGGIIDVESQPDVGSTFHVFLPLADFTEKLEEAAAEERQRRKHSNLPERPRLAAYGNRDIRQFDLMNVLREAGWELGAFTRRQELASFLTETVIPPDVILLIYLGHDDDIEPLLESLLEKHPTIRRALLLLGVNPHTIPQSVLSKVCLVLDETLSVHAMKERLASLFTNN